MNWAKTILAGVVGGIVLTLVNYVMHGLIMAETYTKYAVFSQEQGNPAHFFLVGICTAVMAALLFAKSRASWAEGLVGGAAFGFFLGLAFFFVPFYNPIVLEGFPYYLSWCWGGIDLIGYTILGAVLGLMMKRT